MTPSLDRTDTCPPFGVDYSDPRCATKREGAVSSSHRLGSRASRARFSTMPIDPPGRRLAETLEEDIASRSCSPSGWASPRLHRRTHYRCGGDITLPLIFIAWLLARPSGSALHRDRQPSQSSSGRWSPPRVTLVDDLARGRFLSASARAACRPTPKCSATSTRIGPRCSSRRSIHSRDPGRDAAVIEPKGRFWNISTARTSFQSSVRHYRKPYQKPHPPILVTAWRLSRRG